MNNPPGLLSSSDSLSSNSTKLHLIRQFLEAEDCGNSHFRDDFLKAHPQSEQLLASFLEGLDAVCDFMAGHPPSSDLPAEAFRSLVVGERFEFIEQVGRGRFGVVCRVWDKQLEREVALKFPFRGNNEGEVHQLAVHEAQAAARLRHPNIVGVHEVVQADGLAFIVSDYIPSETLDQWITSTRPPLRETIRVLQQVAKALDYAHQNDVVHRDLKPTNILIDPAGVPHITDFGLAQWSGCRPGHEGHAGGIVGSPYFMSPEQTRAERDNVDGRSDVYALGILLYWVLTERPPFEGDVEDVLRQHREIPPPDPTQFNPTVPTDLAAISLHCLQKDPANRYATAGELALDLGRYLADEPIDIRHASVGRRLYLWTRRHPLTALLSACLACTVATALVVLAMLWRTAEHRLQEVQNERSAHQQTAEQLKLSFLHLTRLLLEDSIAPKSANGQGSKSSQAKASTLSGLGNANVPLLAMSVASTPGEQDKGKTSAHATETPDNLRELEQAVAAWCTILRTDPAPHWYRALALHLFAYLDEAEERGLSGWKRVQPLLSELSNDARNQLQREYVGVLLELAEKERVQRNFEVARRQFVAAVEILEEEDGNRAALLSAQVGLARMLGRLQMPDEQERVLGNALCIVDELQTSALADSNVAIASAEVLVLDARLRRRDGASGEALKQLELADSFATDALDSKRNGNAAHELLAVISDLQGVIYLETSRPELAAAKFLHAAELVSPPDVPSSPDVARKRVRYFQLAGNAYRQARNLEQAHHAYMRAMAVMQDVPLDPREARPIWNDTFTNCLDLSQVHQREGNLGRARDLLEASLELFYRIPERRRSHESTRVIGRAMEDALQSLRDAHF